MAKKNLSIFQLKISLLGTKPPIWRRLLVPVEFTFLDLHRTIQDAMGWRDCHVHQFQIGDIYITSTDYFNDPYTTVLPEKTTNIRNHFVAMGSKVLYVYDLGDNWHHQIELENAIERVEGLKYPRCIAGRRACPPEDCGGTYGFHWLMVKLADPKHVEHKDMKEWMNDIGQEDFKPEVFDHKAVVFKRVEAGDSD